MVNNLVEKCCFDPSSFSSGASESARYLAFGLAFLVLMFWTEKHPINDADSLQISLVKSLEPNSRWSEMQQHFQAIRVWGERSSRKTIVRLPITTIAVYSVG